jgi:formamidopyrimidine-DNA glycosylase
MAGRIAVDEDEAPRQWDRFALEFAGGGGWRCATSAGSAARVIEPDFSHVGPDAAEVGRDVFRDRVGRGSAPLKARLLDQGVIAGVGNLLADETLWRARLSPRRRRASCRSRSSTACGASCARRPRRDPQRRRPHRALHARAGEGRPCPRCKTALARDTIGGRTTYWCPHCQPAS